jgi:hypothetical protein
MKMGAVGSPEALVPEGPSLLWDVIRRRLVDPWKTGPIGFSETLVTNYQRTLRNIPEERRPQLHRGGSLICRLCTYLHSYIDGLRSRNP